MLNRTMLCAGVGSLVLLLAAATSAQELAVMEPETAREYGRMLSDLFAKTEGQQVKIEPSATEATGLQLSGDGIIFVPSKQLDSDKVDPAAESETGAPLAYLFISPRFELLHSGKPFDRKKLRAVKYGDDNSQEREVTALILAVRHLSGGDWRLYFYGSEKKPLIEAKFFDADDPKHKNVGIQVIDMKNGHGTLVVTALKKVEASFEFGY